MLIADQEAIKKYWTDTCPICDGIVISACRCLRNERQCSNGHQWRRLEDGRAMLTTGNGHRDDHIYTGEN